MGMIFENRDDEQQAAMMDTMYVGNSWQIRYLKIRYLAYSVTAVILSVVGTASADYLIFKGTGFSGIIGWLLA